MFQVEIGRNFVHAVNFSFIIHSLVPPGIWGEIITNTSFGFNRYLITFTILWIASLLWKMLLVSLYLFYIKNELGFMMTFLALIPLVKIFCNYSKIWFCYCFYNYDSYFLVFISQDSEAIKHKHFYKGYVLCCEVLSRPFW